ncbi:Short chain dehydrogenase, partial [Globisporangium splendens]
MATKTVLITGCNRGIGLAFTEHYVKQGWKVIASARSIEKASQELKDLAPWKLIPIDTSDEQSILSAAEALKDMPIDLLINNAGVLEHKDLESTTKEDLMRQFEVNAVGPFLTTRAFLSNLRLAVKANGSAFVVQTTSRMGSIADNSSGGFYGYRASKTALNMITSSLAIDLKNEKIGCLLLHPGYVATEMVFNKGNVTPKESVAGLTKIIENATLEDSAKVFHLEGYVLPW